MSWGLGRVSVVVGDLTLCRCFDWPSFLCGAGAAVTNILLTFPANKLMFRQQVDGLRVGQAFRSMRHEGLRSLYRGVGPPLLQKTASLSLMFGMYSWYVCGCVWLCVAVCGCVWLCVAVCMCVWLCEAVCGCVYVCVAVCGCGCVYVCVAVCVWRRVLMLICTYPCADTLRFATPSRYSHHLSFTPVPEVAIGPLAAMLSGATEAVLAPFERMQTLLQLPNRTRMHHHTVHVAMDLRRHGLREYYRGLSVIVLRNSLSNAVFFGLRGPLRDALPGSSEHCTFCSTLRDFASGAVLGATISTAVFPLNVAKSVMQRRVGSSYRGWLWTLRVVMKERGGIIPLYRGVSINFARSLVSWGVINSSYEFLMNHVVGPTWDEDV